MKESKPRGPKNLNIRVTSRGGMAAERQASFQRAVEALLAELVRRLDRPDEGEADGSREEG